MGALKLQEKITGLLLFYFLVTLADQLDAIRVLASGGRRRCD
jgi:hypothetical protein